MTTKNMTVVASWHVVHVVLDDDRDVDLHNKDDDDDGNDDGKDNNGNDDGKDGNDNDDYDDSCFLTLENQKLSLQVINTRSTTSSAFCVISLFL